MLTKSNIKLLISETKNSEKKSNSSVLESNVINVSKNKNLVESNRSVVESTSNTYVNKNKNTIESKISESTSNTYVVDSNKTHSTSETESSSSEFISNTLIVDSNKTDKNKSTFKPTSQTPSENHAGKTDSENNTDISGSTSLEKVTGKTGSKHGSAGNNRKTTLLTTASTKAPNDLKETSKGVGANKKGLEGNEEAVTRGNVVIKPADATIKHKGFNHIIPILNKNIINSSE